MGKTVKPFIVADAAFALSERVMKCFDTLSPTPEQFNFNYALIRTRRVVDCAFGRLKGRFPILWRSRLQNHVFASDVATVCCGLHNFVEERGDVLPRDMWQPFVPSDVNHRPVPQAV